MADTNSRNAMIKQATFQVRNGGSFVRRAPATPKAPAIAKVPPKAPAHRPDKAPELERPAR